MGDVIKPYRCHRHYNLLVKSPSARSLQFHVEVSRKNQLYPLVHSTIAAATYRMVVFPNGGRVAEVHEEASLPPKTTTATTLTNTATTMTATTMTTIAGR